MTATVANAASRGTRLLLLLALFHGCSGTPSGPTPPETLERTCSNVENEAAHLMVEGKNREALERYGEAVELCKDVPIVLNRVLNNVADIAKRSTVHCGLARQIHGRAAFREDTDYLRSRVHLSHACGSQTDLESGFNQLVQAASRKLYGQAAGEMEPLVRHYERTQFDYWVPDAAQHLQSLREATRQLCSDDRRIALVFEAANRVGISRDNELSLLGFWMLQPPEAVDDDSRSCISHVASMIKARETEFDPRVRQDIAALLQWVDGGFQKPPTAH